MFEARWWKSSPVTGIAKDESPVIYFYQLVCVVLR